MIFQTFEAYIYELEETEELEETINKLTESNNSSECFICFENNPVPSKLKNQCIYIKLCDCDGLIHENCLRTWYDKTGQCPICRIKLDNINPIISDFNVFIIFITVKKIIIRALNIFVLFFVLYSTCKLYFLVLNQYLQEEKKILEKNE